MSRQHNRSRYTTADGIPIENRRLVNFRGPIRAIGDTVLNAKQDIKFHRGAETRRGAEKYARRHNLLLGPVEDINGDQIPDVVLYRDDGTPVMINGWTVAPSEYPYRVVYDERYPKKSDRIRIGGYSGFMNAYRRNEIQDLPYDRFRAEVRGKGFKAKPEKKQRELTLYQAFSKEYINAIKNYIMPHFERINRTWIVKAIPYLNLASFGYLDVVIRQLWNIEQLQTTVRDIKAKTDDPHERYKLFKDKITSKDLKSDITKYYKSIWDGFIDELKNNTERIDVELSLIGISDVAAEDADVPTDDQMNEMNSRVYKAETQEDMINDIAEGKDRLITEIFSD